MDLADEAGNIMEVESQRREAAVRHAAQSMPKGTPGDCDECGLESQRLVLGVCAPCRDFLAELEKRS